MTLKMTRKFIAASALLACAGAALAQTTVPAPENVLQLSATGTVEVQQDVLVMTLGTTKEGADANAVQTQLRQAIDTALTEAKRDVKPQQLDVRTGTFGLYPRYGKDGKVNGWQGRAELVLQGRDFPRITSTAARIQTLSISQVAFDLSREARARVEGEAQTRAIEAFKGRATELARGFGFNGYTLREVAVNNNEMIPGPRMPMMAKAASAMSMGAEDSGIPAEAGKAQVVVNVSGSVQLR